MTSAVETASPVAEVVGPDGSPKRGLSARLQRLERGLTLLAYMGGALALAVAFEAPAMLVVGLVVGVAFPLARSLKLKSGPLLEVALTALGVMLALPLGLTTREPAPGLAMFLLVAQAVKMVAPRNARDPALARMVGIVLAGVAAAEGVELYFGAALFGCVVLNLLSGVLATVSGQVALVRQEGEAPASAVGGTPGLARIVGSHGVVLVVLGFLAGGTFLLIPRMGAKLLPRRSGSTQRMAGFSDMVGLEDIGRIKLNNAVALRLEFEDPTQSPEELYLRGAVLDRYDGSTWQTSQLVSFGLRLEALNALEVRDPLLQPRANEALAKALVYLQPIGSKYMFTLGTTERVRFKATRPRGLRRNAHGCYTLDRPYDVALVYELNFYPDHVPRLLLNSTLANHIRRSCLRLPNNVNQPRLTDYARSVLSRQGLDLASSPAQIAAALDQHLRTQFRYTTVSTRNPEVEPVEEFLFDKRQGHCEYFASSLVVLLRCLGIPARLVTGLRGGANIDWSETVTVRQSSAHAWVEALLDGRWQRFDPTPADPEVEAGGTFTETMEAFLEWIELKWFQYVIAFDAYDQQNALFLLQQRLEPFLAAIGERLTHPGARAAATAVVLLVALALVALVVRRLRRRSWRGGLVLAPPPAQCHGLFQLLHALARHDLVRRPDETPQELAVRADQRLQLAGLREWILRYYGQRYGGRATTPEEQSDLQTLLDRLATL